MYAQYPDDPDVCAFYALALLMTSSSAASYLSAVQSSQVRRYTFDTAVFPFGDSVDMRQL